MNLVTEFSWRMTQLISMLLHSLFWRSKINVELGKTDGVAFAKASVSAELLSGELHIQELDEVADLTEYFMNCALGRSEHGQPIDA